MPSIDMTPAVDPLEGLHKTALIEYYYESDTCERAKRVDSLKVVVGTCMNPERDNTSYQYT